MEIFSLLDKFDFDWSTHYCELTTQSEVLYAESTMVMKYKDDHCAHGAQVLLQNLTKKKVTC